MKRFLIISMMCFMAISLCACGKTKENGTDNKTELSEVMDHGDEKDITDDSKNTTEKGTEKVESRSSDNLEDVDVIEDTTEDASENVTEATIEATTEDKTYGATEDIAENAESTSKKTENIDSEAENESQKEDDDTTLDPFVGEYNSYDVDEPDLEIQKNADGTYKIQIGIYRLISLDDCVGERTEEGIAFLADRGDKVFRGTITLEGDIATVTFFGSDWLRFAGVSEYKYYKTSNIPNIYVPNY